MANINVQAQTGQSKAHQGRKRLKRILRQYRNDFDDMTNAKKWGLVKRTMIILIRLELARIGQLGDDD